MEKLKKEQIDWAEYRKDLTGSIANERLWALGYHGERSSNPHIENYNKLEKELEILDNGDHDSVLDLHADAPGYFDDVLLDSPIRMEDKTGSFRERATDLRLELTNAIINLLEDNGLAEIKLSGQPAGQSWMVWFDRRGYGYNSRVTKVFLQAKRIAFEVYDEDCCCSETLTSDDDDLSCTNIDRLCDILDSINYTLNLPISAGSTMIAGQTVEWSYDEPGLPELPENGMEEIETRLAEGIHEGTLRYYDEYELEFNGTWKVRNN